MLREIASFPQHTCGKCKKASKRLIIVAFCGGSKWDKAALDPASLAMLPNPLETVASHLKLEILMGSVFQRVWGGRECASSI
jgi:hypothetical protein